MTAAERAYLKHEIDHAIRARLSRVEKRCKGCGMPMDDWTPGCRTCGDRHRRYRERGDERWNPYVAMRVQSEWGIQLSIDGTRDTVRKGDPDFAKRAGTWSQHAAALRT